MDKDKLYSLVIYYYKDTEKSILFERIIKINDIDFKNEEIIEKFIIKTYSNIYLKNITMITDHQYYDSKLNICACYTIKKIAIMEL